MDAAPTVLAAFGAGVLSVVSPAVVPLLPGLNGFVWQRGILQTDGRQKVEARRHLQIECPIEQRAQPLP